VAADRSMNSFIDDGHDDEYQRDGGSDGDDSDNDGDSTRRRRTSPTGLSADRRGDEAEDSDVKWQRYGGNAYLFADDDDEGALGMISRLSLYDDDDVERDCVDGGVVIGPLSSSSDESTIEDELAVMLGDMEDEFNSIMSSFEESVDTSVDVDCGAV
jgi:hypothetical protein